VFAAKLDSVVGPFSDQFTPDGAGYVYRRSQKGAAYRVTAAERDAFVATFRRRIAFAMWLLVPLTVAVIIGLALLLPDAANTAVSWAAVAVIVAPLMAVVLFAWNAPARKLERRTPLGEPLSRSEARRVAFSHIGYGRLATVVPVTALLLWRVSEDHDVVHGWGRLWLVAAAGMIGLAAVQALRKWRLERA
jgi:hypothetical protein